MTKLFSFLLIIAHISLFYAQAIPQKELKRSIGNFVQDTLRSKTKKSIIGETKAHIEDYLIIGYKNDTTYVDTTLTIQKLYNFNYLRKDNFELIPFSNIGQPYNTLSYDFGEQLSTMPSFGAQARHFNYYNKEDINYYHVPTPLTELFYKTAFEQGQLLDAFFTINTSRQLNMSIAYKGLRSLGKYQNILTSTGNFRVTANYTSKNNRYKSRAHIVTQDLLNNENGGIKDEDIINFENGESEFLDRSVFDPNFQNAENILVGKRFHLDHSFVLVTQKDSTSKEFLEIGNVVTFEDKYYRYIQTTAETEYFGESLTSSVRDKVTLEDFNVRGFARFNVKYLGTVQANVDYANINYGYETVVNLNGNQIVNRIKEDFFKIGGIYNNKIGAIKLGGEFSINLSDEFKGYFVDAEGSVNLNKDNVVKFGASINNSRPNYNFLLYQSDYIEYNWYHQDDFENVSIRQLEISTDLKKLPNLSFDLTSIENYTYFQKNENNSVKPFQTNETVNYLRIKANKEFRFGNFGIDNTIMYQKVLNGDGVLNIPEIISRNTLYYQNHLFKRALFLQTGVTLNYFTDYYMNAYDPLLAEFYNQTTTKFGAFPRLDFFVNAKVRQTRIFFIAEHFNSSFTGYNYYSAPNYLYRDFTIRFGLVWNFFL